MSITIVNHRLIGDMAEIGFHLSNPEAYRKINIRVNNDIRQIIEPTASGVVRFTLPFGRVSHVRLTAVSAVTGHYSTTDIAEFDVRSSAPAVDTRHRQQSERKSGFASIGLCNPKDAANIGGVIRAAQAYDAASIAISGERIKGHEIRHGTNTGRGDKHIPIYRGDLRDLIPFGAVPVAVELIDRADPLFTFNHPKSAFYIFGPEDSSLGKSVLDWCPYVVQIPTTICMNLAATVNVVLYDRAMKKARG